MRSFTAALLVIAGLASGTKIEAKSQIEAKAETKVADHPLDYDSHPGDAYPGYFNNPNHVLADYEHPYTGSLPSADFNKQVYNFDDDKNIFDQKSYEMRVKIEAELMIALESLKESVKLLEGDTTTVGKIVKSQRDQIRSTFEESERSIESLRAEFTQNVDRLDTLFGECHLTQKDLDQAKEALVLYCQQFAFDQAMVRPCQNLLNGQQRLLSYKYKFSGKSTIDQYH